MKVLPTIGQQAFGAALSKMLRTLTWKPVAVEVSKAGDMVYTYGICEFRADTWDGKTVESSSYPRICEKQPDGQGKFILNVANSIPQSANESRF